MKKLSLLLAFIGLLFASCETGGSNDGPNTDVKGASIASIEEQMVAIEHSLPELRSVVAKAQKFTSEPKASTRSDNNGVKTLIAELEARIAALEEYINGGGSGEWTDVTYATMEMYENTIAILVALQAEVDALKEQNNALSSEVFAAINESVDSMKSWINELLTGYYDIATVDAMFASLLEELSSADTDIRAEIESLRATLAKELATMEEAYKDAIKSAIEENNGVLDKKLTEAITDVNKRIDDEVAKLNQRIDDIEERLTKLEGSVSDLLKRIQSIAYVPINEDGKARVTFPNDNTSGATLQLDFMISPKDAAADLAKVYDEAVTIQVLYSGSPVMTTMPIISCDAIASQGLFSVTCACDDISMEFYRGDITARAIMYISDGNNDRTSEYITIIPNRTQIQNNQIWYTVSNKLPIEIGQDGGPRIVSNEYDSVAGHYVVTFESDIYAIPASYFNNCEKLTSVTLPNSVNTIEAKAFACCYSLTAISLGNSLGYIDSCAFEYSGLSSLTLPASLWGVAPDAFLHSNIYHLEGECVADDGISLVFGKTLTAIAPAALGEEYVVPATTTAIGEAVFKECHNLKDISIHNNITSIGNEAFSYCTSLSNITIPDSVESLGSEAFSYCENLTTITIGNGITSIADGLFSNLGRLTDITIGSGVTTIGSCAFSNCTSLSNITIPDGVKSLGYSVFSNCSSLQSVKLGVNVESINREMFSGCDNIREFRGKFASEDGCCLIVDNKIILFAKACDVDEYSIPEGIKTIDTNAFDSCTNLKQVTIPKSVTNIGEYAFAYCKNIDLFTFKSTTPPTIGNGVFNGVENLRISIPKEAVEAYLTCDWPYEYRRAIIELSDINNIPDSCRLYYTTNDNKKLNVYPENGYSVLSHTYADGQGVVVFFEPLTSIGDRAFYWCPSLESITIPDSVTSIGKNAFYSCSSLESITIPDSVTSIGDYAFCDCSSLESITIPDSVTSIGDIAFASCSSLKSITIPDGVTSIGDSAFNGCSSLTSVTIPDTVTSIGDNAFYWCSRLESITIPDGVTSIGDSAFDGCSRLTSVTIGNSVTSIGDNTFYNCSSLESVTIGDSVTSIGDYAFCNCSSLESITIPDSVTSIGDYVFEGCTSLASVTIGNSVTSIGDRAFYYCSSLESITIPDSVTSIGNSAFNYCSSLESITIPNSVTSIGTSAFSYCSRLAEFKGKFASEDGRCLIVNGVLNSFADAGLTEYTIPDSVTSIGSFTFASCIRLTSITIPDSVTSIGNCAFYNCSSLTSVTIPDSVTSIGNYAFNYCSNLASVTIPDSVTSIGDEAFACCFGLASVYCKPITPPKGGTEMFENGSLKIYVPMASVDAYKSASYWTKYKSQIYGYDF